MNHPGMRVSPRIEGAPACVRERFATIPTATLSDNMCRAFGTSRLIAVHGKKAFVGNAVTIKTRPGDNLMIHRAMDMLHAGDALVVDGGGALDNALIGELIMLMAIEKGATGFIIDGAVRDVAAFRAAEFPCYARGISHRGPYKDGPGEINAPIAVDGMVVQPGDIIVGDEDGLVAIRPEDAEQVCAGAVQQINKEEVIKTRIRTHSYHREWLEPLLRQNGIET
jgi:RraA family protein